MLTGDLPGDIFGIFLGIVFCGAGAGALAMVFIGLFEKIHDSKSNVPPMARVGLGEHIPALDNFALMDSWPRNTSAAAIPPPRQSDGWRRRNPRTARKHRQ